VDKYRELAASTVNASVLNGIGAFAGMFSLREILKAGAGMADPVLVSGTDGVGTKLELALHLKQYEGVGIDCVAMCVNDVLCHGGLPLFFLDYLACGKLDADVAAALVRGVARGCRETGYALLGGETAEMPGFYPEGRYDIAGFAVGIVDRPRIVDGRRIRPGDTIIGVASSGPHSNGFSLIRKVIPNLDEDFGGMPIGHALLEATRLYVKPVLALMDQIDVRGMAHITGGAFYENIPRMFPRNGGAPAFDAVIDLGSWTIPPIFARIASGVADTGLTGAQAERSGAERIKRDDALRKLLFNTFNMGIGFVLALAPEDSRRAIETLDAFGYPAWEIGRVAPARGAGEVVLRGTL
jgi:phosphoribosylformylglycinamidine cyclo-ligase